MAGGIFILRTEKCEVVLCRTRTRKSSMINKPDVPDPRAYKRLY